MVKNDNKILFAEQKAEETSKNERIGFTVTTADSRGKHLNKTDHLKINLESKIHNLEPQMDNKEMDNTYIKAETVNALYDFSPVGFFTLTSDGTIEHINRSAEGMLGLDPAVSASHNLREYISQDSLAAYDDFLQKAFETGTRQTGELTLRNLVIASNSVHVYVEGIISDKDKCLMTAVNIGRQKQTEDQNLNSEYKKNGPGQKGSEARYRKLFESSKDGIVIIDIPHGNIIDVNPFFSCLLGYSKEEILDKSLWNIGIFQNISDSEELIKELQHKDFIRYDNILLSTKTGKPVHVEFTVNSYVVEQQKVVQCNIHNISERIQAEKKIHTLGKAIEQGPTAITITNAEGKIEFVNNKFVELTQYQPSDVIGKNARIFHAGHLTHEEYTSLWQTLKSGRTWEGQVMNRRKDRTYFWEETTIAPVKDLEGNISNYILIQNDISEKKQIIQDLILAKEKAIESDMLKTAFLANMSHEIRTPLNSIIGFSELMMDDEFDQNQLTHFAKIINASGIKLLSIISDIMDLSRIEAGEIKVDKRRLSVNQLIANIQKEYLFKAVEKGLEINIDSVASSNEVFINSDENKLRQILFNFVGNAIKFTEKGTVEIGMEQKDGFVEIRVKDTGIGIPAQYQDQIFERFRQVESAFSKKYGGNGLGLAISKALVELLGGQIGMETEQGKGSTFYFTVPVA
jgi:PAS domain S-box-containing protein